MSLVPDIYLGFIEFYRSKKQKKNSFFLDKNRVDKIDKIERPNIEKLTKSLMTRMYKKGSSDSSESEEDQDETDNSNFEETLYKSVAEAVAESKVLCFL